MLQFLKLNINMEVCLGFRSLKEEVWTKRCKALNNL